MWQPMSETLPTYFISHGGGPWPWMKHEQPGVFDALEKSIVDVRQELKDRAKAVLMISGHWEEPAFTVSSGEHPGMVYDYYGFPDYTYRIHYDAPGSPEKNNRFNPNSRGRKPSFNAVSARCSA